VDAALVGVDEVVAVARDRLAVVLLVSAKLAIVPSELPQVEFPDDSNRGVANRRLCRPACDRRRNGELTLKGHSARA